MVCSNTIYTICNDLVNVAAWTINDIPGTMSATQTTMSGADEVYMKPSTRLRKLLSHEGVCIQAPGVYDGICARIAIEQGFQVMVSLSTHLPKLSKTEFNAVSIWSNDNSSTTRTS